MYTIDKFVYTINKLMYTTRIAMYRSYYVFNKYESFKVNIFNLALSLMGRQGMNIIISKAWYRVHSIPYFYKYIHNYLLTYYRYFYCPHSYRSFKIEHLPICEGTGLVKNHQKWYLITKLGRNKFFWFGNLYRTVIFNFDQLSKAKYQTQWEFSLCQQSLQ